MKKYKIVNSTIPHFMNIEVPFDFSAVSIGDSINVFGENITVTQVGSIIAGHNENNVFTMQEIVEIEVPEKTKEILNDLN